VKRSEAGRLLTRWILSRRQVYVAMPLYVEHSDGATEIGKLSAEAVISEYEAAAKEIEAMGMELIERVKQCEGMTRDALAVTAELNETARRYREEAKRVFLQIENCSRVTAEVRQTCTDLKEKIALKRELPVG
jgi:phosphoglycolate phosphatase-like HAD superfamily hydrolase